MLSGLGLEKFKAFNEQNYVPFKKMNVFLGPNSSGKSSFLKGLLLLNETMKSSDVEPALQLTEEMGDFKSIIYGGDPKKRMTFMLTFDEEYASNVADDTVIRAKHEALFFSAAVNINESDTISKQELNQFTNRSLNRYFENPLTKITFSLKQTPKRPNVIQDMKLHFQKGNFFTIEMKGNSYYLMKGEQEFSQPNLFDPYKFYFQINGEKFQKSNADELEDILHVSIAFTHAERKLQHFFQRFLRIEPFRHRPKRTELVANFKYRTVGSDGSNTLSAVIGMNQSSEKNQIDDVKNEINKWLNEFMLAQSIDAVDLRNNQYSLIIKNKYTGIESNIVDVGVGTSQLLPIILESFLSPKRSVLVIEEPETHIHPNAQAMLATMFMSCIKRDQKQFFIETHSMYFVQKLQVLIAQGELSPEDVGVYYFNQGADGTQVEELPISTNGQFEKPFPPGFFDVAFELSKQLMKAMAKAGDSHET